MTRAGGRVLAVLFAVYLALLTWAVLWKLEVPYVGGGPPVPVKLVPFAATATSGPSAQPEVAANVALFVPFGLYLGLLAPRWPWWKAVAVVACFSAALEAFQSFLAVGVPDVSDLVANTAGGLLGIGLLASVRVVQPRQVPQVLTRTCAGATGVALVAVGVFVSSPHHHGPPADVGPLRCSASSDDGCAALSP